MFSGPAGFHSLVKQVPGQRGTITGVWKRRWEERSEWCPAVTAEP